MERRAIHVVVGGGSGFIGAALTRALRERGDRVTWISRAPGADRITWDGLRAEGLPACDAVVNLAGKHILNLQQPWDDAYKAELIASRVETTRALVNSINASVSPPSVFVSTAGKCFYGTRELTGREDYPILDESSEPMGLDYPAELVRQWESAAGGVDPRVRHAKVRVGVVLGAVERKSWLGRFWRIGAARGFLPIIRLPFCLGLGCAIGSGKQPFPWIHIDDMVGVLMHVIDEPGTSGKYNAVAPGIVNNADFTRAFGRALRRPVVWTAPSWLVRAIVGDERSSILLEGQHVVPRRTLESGYRFRFPTIDAALDNLVQITF
jgi:uncharacterized protein